jgi:hypothetical protein
MTWLKISGEIEKVFHGRAWLSLIKIHVTFLHFVSHFYLFLVHPTRNQIILKNILYQTSGISYEVMILFKATSSIPRTFINYSPLFVFVICILIHFLFATTVHFCKHSVSTCGLLKLIWNCKWSFIIIGQS